MGGLPSQGGGGPRHHRHVEISNRPHVKTSVSGNIVQISGQQVEISGQPVTTSISGNIVQISGQAVTTSVSGNIVQISGQQVEISGQPVTVSGNIVIIGSPTNPVIDFNTAENVPSTEDSIHTYTATGHFNVSKIEASASGLMRIDIQSGNPGAETTKLVAFTSDSNRMAYMFFNNELQITSGQTILVIRTNRELQAMDVFSTIMGFNL